MNLIYFVRLDGGPEEINWDWNGDTYLDPEQIESVSDCVQNHPNPENYSMRTISYIRTKTGEDVYVVNTAAVNHKYILDETVPDSAEAKLAKAEGKLKFQQSYLEILAKSTGVRPAMGAYTSTWFEKLCSAVRSLSGREEDGRRRVAEAARALSGEDMGS